MPQPYIFVTDSVNIDSSSVLSVFEPAVVGNSFPSPGTLLYLPEMDYYLQKYWVNVQNSSIFNIPMPIVYYGQDTVAPPPNSIFQLMFSDATFGDSSCNYLFKEIDYKSFSMNIINRLRYTGKEIGCYITDVTGTYNILKISEEVKPLIQQMINYRNLQPVNLSGIQYPLLEPLFNLMYIYLDVMYNDNTSRILDMSSALSAPTNHLENIFEIYTNNEIHKTISLFDYS